MTAPSPAWSWLSPRLSSTWKDGEGLGLGCALPPAPVDQPLLCKMEGGGSGHRPLATLEETLVQRGAQSVVQPLLSPGREWNVWEMALQGIGVGGHSLGRQGHQRPLAVFRV